MEAKFGIKSMDGLRDAENSHSEYEIERKLGSWWRKFKKPNTAVSPLYLRLDMFRFAEKKRI